MIKDVLARGWSGEEELTPREEEMIKLVAEAHATKQIAELLHLSEKTVKNPAPTRCEARYARPRRAGPIRDPPRPDRALTPKPTSSVGFGADAVFDQSESGFA